MREIKTRSDRGVLFIGSGLLWKMEGKKIPIFLAYSLLNGASYALFRTLIVLYASTQSRMVREDFEILYDVLA